MSRLIAFLSMLAFGCVGKSQHSSTLSPQNDAPAEKQQEMTQDFYTLTSTTLSGEEFRFESLKGKIVVILNVASECGYTPQYADWQKFYTENADSDVVVIGVPCNQFLWQEPGDAKDIAAFCQKNYGVTFPMLEKQKVKGNEKSPLYQWLTTPSLNGWNESEPAWNFSKYLINREGKLVHFFGSKITPASDEWVEVLSKL